MVVIALTAYILKVLQAGFYGLILAIPKMKNVVLSLKAKERRFTYSKYPTDTVKKLNFLSILKK